ASFCPCSDFRRFMACLVAVWRATRPTYATAARPSGRHCFGAASARRIRRATFRAGVNPLPPLAHDTVRFGVGRLGFRLIAPPSFGRPPLCFLLGARLQSLADLQWQDLE